MDTKYSAWVRGLARGRENDDWEKNGCLPARSVFGDNIPRGLALRGLVVVNDRERYKSNDNELWMLIE